METLIAPTVNLLILISVLVYYLRQPLKDFIQTRHSTLKEELGKARDEMTKAKSEFAEFSAKLSSFDGEAKKIREEAQEEVKALKVRIADEGQRMSKNIVADARAAASTLYSELKGQLYVELSARVLERAEALLRDKLTGDDRTRIRKEFSSQLEKSPMETKR